VTSWIGQYHLTVCLVLRAVGRSENSGVPVLFGRHNLPPLVEIGLTDRPKIGGATRGSCAIINQSLVEDNVNLFILQVRAASCLAKIFRYVNPISTRGGGGQTTPTHWLCLT
jgi:hypothetical protein